MAFDEACTTTRNIDTSLQREVLAGAKEARSAAHAKAVEKLKVGKTVHAVKRAHSVERLDHE